MELICSSELILRGYDLDVEKPVSDILVCDLFGTKDGDSTIVEISDNAIVLGKTGTLASHIDGAGLILGATSGFSGPRPHIVYRDEGEFEFIANRDSHTSQPQNGKSLKGMEMH